MIANDPFADERGAWNAWNAANREQSQGRISLDQSQAIERWMRSLFTDRHLDILEVGCGTGWMSQRLSSFGKVTAIDLADEVQQRRLRAPQIDFIAADFMKVDLGRVAFDVVIGLETIAHVVDQAGFRGVFPTFSGQVDT